MNATERLGLVVLFCLAVALGFVWAPHLRARRPEPEPVVEPGVPLEPWMAMALAWEGRLAEKQAVLAELGEQGAQLVWEWPDGGLYVGSRN